jgi:hypothetical protein
MTMTKAKSEEVVETQNPSLAEAQVMFAENPGLAAVLITTDAGPATAHRDGRVEPLSVK